jgi:hypothetical protein
MWTKWTAKGNRDAGSSCSCDRRLHWYLAEYLYIILMALIHTAVTMLTSRHALEREKKYHCGGDSWRGGLFTKQLKKRVKAVFLLGCYWCIFHGTGNSAQLCQNVGISGGGGVWTPQKPPSVRHCTTAHCEPMGPLVISKRSSLILLRHHASSIKLSPD